MVGGSARHSTRARPLLAQFAETVCYVGPSGTGTAMKLVANRYT